MVKTFTLLNLDLSDDEGKKKSPKKRAGYEKDEDFDAPNAKNDDEFAPDPNRYVVCHSFEKMNFLCFLKVRVKAIAKKKKKKIIMMMTPVMMMMVGKVNVDHHQRRKAVQSKNKNAQNMFF